MNSVSRRARAAGAIAAAVVTLVVITGAAPAHGDPISDKKAQAAAIAAQIDQLNHTVEQYAEAANGAQAEVDALNQQVAEAQSKVAAATAERDKRRSELRDYAVDAYVRGSDDDAAQVSGAGADDVNLAGQRLGYLTAAAGNRQQLIDQLNATEQDVQLQISQLAATQSAAQAKSDLLNQKRSAAAAAVAQQQALKNQVDSDLSRLVAEEQARQEQARQAAAAQRAAAAQAAASRSSVGRSVSGGSSGGVSSAPVASNPGAQTAVNTAMAQVGKPYQWGAAGPSSFDCSGLIMYSWGAAGRSLSHYVPSQYSETRHISQDQLQPGDIVYYNGFGHDAMYIGGGQVVQALHTGDFVRVTSIYYAGDPIAFSRP